MASWQPVLPSAGPVAPAAATRIAIKSETRSHTLTGLIVGAVVGGLGTYVALNSLCSDADEDTDCGGESSRLRAALIVAVPAAALGALVGTLIKTKK
jgi:hypothetical protein